MTQLPLPHVAQGPFAAPLPHAPAFPSFVVVNPTPPTPTPQNTPTSTPTSTAPTSTPTSTAPTSTPTSTAPPSTVRLVCSMPFYPDPGVDLSAHSSDSRKSFYVVREGRIKGTFTNSFEHACTEWADHCAANHGAVCPDANINAPRVVWLTLPGTPSTPSPSDVSDDEDDDDFSVASSQLTSASSQLTSAYSSTPMHPFGSQGTGNPPSRPPVMMDTRIHLQGEEKQRLDEGKYWGVPSVLSTFTSRAEAVAAARIQGIKRPNVWGHHDKKVVDDFIMSASVADEYWRLFHWRLPLDEEPGDDAMVVMNEVEELTAEEEKNKTAVQTRIKSKIKTWYNHHRNAMGMTSNPYTPWLARLRRPDGASPKRVTDYQFYMQHEEFKAAVEEEFQLRHAHEPRRQHLSLRCQVAREFFERESEEVKKRIRLEARLEHEDHLEQWKDAEEGLPSANEEEQVEARLRFSAVVTPLLNALRAYTSYHITLIAGRLVDDGKVALVSVHSGKTKAKSVDLEKDFTEWDEGGYKVVLDQFVRFLVDANVEPREETEMTEPAPTTAPLPTASTSPTPIATTASTAASVPAPTRASTPPPDGIPLDLGRQTTPPPLGSLEARMIELGVRTALRRELESMDEEARESRVTELMGLSAMALQRENKLAENRAGAKTASLPAAGLQVATEATKGKRKRKPTHKAAPKTAPKKKRARLEESDDEESAESSGSDVSEGEGRVEPPQTRARRRGASGGEGANGENGDAAKDHNNDTAARETASHSGQAPNNDTTARETASHGGGAAKNNDTDARGTASQDADAANDHNNNTAARETANHGGKAPDNNAAARETASHGGDVTNDKDVPVDEASSSIQKSPKKGGRKAKTVAKTSEGAVPKWARDAREVMEKEWKGWGELVSLWWKLEEGSGFTSKGGALTTKGRPTEVGWWIQRARKGTPPIKDVGAFAQAWKGWWGALNPAWRRVKTGGMAQEGDGGWEELGARGANGLLSVVMCLKWWKEGLGNAEDEEWVESVLDVTWVLRRLIASDAGVEGDVDVDMG
ncbi:hypothetical protein C8R46DRAFT_1041099 [Mycena filopes]|nr:hypothetical protein C8R46DRAFT_1041099 [Mycena filopes]